jgi:hypothetical protein
MLLVYGNADMSKDPIAEFAYDIGVYLHENAQNIYPHLPGISFPAPPGYESRKVVEWRPWGEAKPPTTRPARLGREIAEIYRAVAFANAQYGVVMNTHITIACSRARITDHRTAAGIAGCFLHEATKWQRVGNDAGPRERHSTRSRMGGNEFHHVYVHENTRDIGFHTHILCHVPDHKAKAFEAWTGKCLRRLPAAIASRNLKTSTSVGPVGIHRTISLSISTNSPMSGSE